jgi:hypothetical protein
MALDHKPLAISDKCLERLEAWSLAHVRSALDNEEFVGGLLSIINEEVKDAGERGRREAVALLTEPQERSRSLPTTIAKKGEALRKIDEVWELHGRVPARRPAGCLAFVVDRRHVEEDGIERRLAVSFGENLFPRVGLEGFLNQEPMPGEYCFGIHIVGTRGGRIAPLGEWYDGREASGLEDPAQAEEVARAILAGISDDDYAGCVAHDPNSRPPVTVSPPLPLDGYEMVRDFEP